MQGKFEIIIIGEKILFLRLQLKKNKECVFISQAKYTRDLLKKYGMESASTMKNYDLFILKCIAMIVKHFSKYISR